MSTPPVSPSGRTWFSSRATASADSSISAGSPPPNGRKEWKGAEHGDPLQSRSSVDLRSPPKMQRVEMMVESRQTGRPALYESPCLGFTSSSVPS